MKKDTIARISGENVDDKVKIVQELFNFAFKNAASRAKMSEKELSLVEGGKRRNLHDDITIVCVDLNRQI